MSPWENEVGKAIMIERIQHSTANCAKEDDDDDGKLLSNNNFFLLWLYCTLLLLLQRKESPTNKAKKIIRVSFFKIDMYGMNTTNTAYNIQEGGGSSLELHLE